MKWNGKPKLLPAAELSLNPSRVANTKVLYLKKEADYMHENVADGGKIVLHFSFVLKNHYIRASFFLFVFVP